MTANDLHEQHERMQRLFHEVAAVMVAEKHPSLYVLIEELVRVLGEHCRDEETFMRQIGYPEISGHQWQHEVVLGDAERIRVGVQDGAITLADAVNGLRAIVIDHMKDTDSEMFAYAHRGQQPHTT